MESVLKFGKEQIPKWKFFDSETSTCVMLNMIQAWQPLGLTIKRTFLDSVAIEEFLYPVLRQISSFFQIIEATKDTFEYSYSFLHKDGKIPLDLTEPVNVCGGKQLSLYGCPL